MPFCDKDHFCAVVGVGANSKYAPLLIKRELIKAHWTYETEIQRIFVKLDQSRF